MKWVEVSVRPPHGLSFTEEHTRAFMGQAVHDPDGREVGRIVATAAGPTSTYLVGDDGKPGDLVFDEVRLTVEVEDALAAVLEDHKSAYSIDGVPPVRVRRES